MDPIPDVEKSHRKLRYMARYPGRTATVLGVIVLCALTTYRAKAWHDEQTANPPDLVLGIADEATGTQLALNNRGQEPLYLWGDKFDECGPVIESTPRTIPAGLSYRLQISRDQADQITRRLGANGARLISLDAYYIDRADQAWTQRFAVLVTMQHGIGYADAQNLGPPVKGGWAKPEGAGNQ